MSAKYVDGYRLAVTFADGTSGVVDLAQHIRAGGVFARLADVSAFKQFSINPVAQPSLRDWSRRGRIPGVETPGYCRLSIRDREKASSFPGRPGVGSGLTGHGLGGTLPT